MTDVYVVTCAEEEEENQGAGIQSVRDIDFGAERPGHSVTRCSLPLSLLAAMTVVEHPEMKSRRGLLRPWSL